MGRRDESTADGVQDGWTERGRCVFPGRELADAVPLGPAFTCVTRVNLIQGPLLLTVIELVVLAEVSRRVVDVMVGLSGAGDRSFTRYCRGRISRDRCARANRGRDRAGRRRGYRRYGAHRGGRVLHPRRVHLARHPRPLYASISLLSKTRDSSVPQRYYLRWVLSERHWLRFTEPASSDSRALFDLESPCTD